MPPKLENTEFDRFVRLEEKCAGKKNPPKCDKCEHLKPCRENHDRYAEVFDYDPRLHRKYYHNAVKEFDQLRRKNYAYKGPRKAIPTKARPKPRP